MAYMDYMGIDVPCLRKAVQFNHSHNHSLLRDGVPSFEYSIQHILIYFFLKLIVACILCVIYVRDHDSNV